jgi:SnoaL-like domain
LSGKAVVKLLWFDVRSCPDSGHEIFSKDFFRTVAAARSFDQQCFNWSWVALNLVRLMGGSAKMVGTKMCPLARRERVATLFRKRITRETVMDAQSFKAAVEDLIAKVVGGKALDAFDRYYADDVTMQENEQPPRVGKAACRAFEEDFFSKIKAVRTYVCDGYVISDNKAYIVYRVDADHADWGTLKMSEVAIQEWSNGKVVREKFVY